MTDIQNKTNSSVRNALLWFIAILALTAFGISSFSSGNVTILSDLFSLVGQHSLFDKKIGETASRQQQKLIVVLAHPNKASAQTASKQLADDLAALVSVNTATRLPFNQAQIDQITALYKDYPFTLLNDDYAQAIDDGKPKQLNELFINTLLQPGNPFVDMTIEQDPTLGLANALAQKLASQSQWSNDGDALYQYLQEDQHLDSLYYYPIFIELAQANLGVNQSVAIEQQINQLLEKAQENQAIKIYRSGLLFHISGSTVQAQSEITLFGVISSTIILAATLWVFRSLMPLLVIVLIMGVSITFGTAGLLSFVSEIHLITFIFAISLIGISVDYAFHVLAGAALKQTQDSNQSLAKYLAPAMLMGALTTVLGYCGMLLMPIDALHQITIFMIFGLLGAVATALFWLAPLYSSTNSSHNKGKSRSIKLSDSTTRFIQQLTERLAPLRKKRHVAAVLIVLAGLFLLAGGRFHFDDNVRSLNSSSTKLVSEEQKIQQLMGYNSYPRYIAVTAEDDQRVLSNMNQITLQMNKIADTGLALRTQSLSLWIPPKAIQQQRKSQVKAFNDKDELALMKSYLEPEQFKAVIDKLDSHFEPKAWPEELMILAQPLFQDNGKSYGLIRYYAKLSPAQQQTVQGELQDVSFFDQPQRLTESLTEVRTSLLLFFIMAAGAFAVILVLRYGLKYGLMALITPVFAALGALVISQLIVSNMSIFNLLACLLIVALAVDYSVFFNEQGHQKHVVLAVLLSAVSSMAAFGMMTFSQTPAVHHFGLSTLIGIGLAVLLSFITPLRPRKPNEQLL
jgi:predicted exporter